MRGAPTWLLPRDSLAATAETANREPGGPAVAAPSSHPRSASLQPLAAPPSVACVGGDDGGDDDGDGSSGSSDSALAQAWDPASFRWFWRMAHAPPPPPAEAAQQTTRPPNGVVPTAGASGAGGARDGPDEAADGAGGTATGGADETSAAAQSGDGGDGAPSSDC